MCKTSAVILEISVIISDRIGEIIPKISEIPLREPIKQVILLQRMFFCSTQIFNYFTLPH
jgi:hypothetical protein